MQALTIVGPGPTSRPQPPPVPTNNPGGGGGGGCAAKHWDQCGGNNWKGCTRCEVRISPLSISISITKSHRIGLQITMLTSHQQVAIHVQRRLRTVLLPMSIKTLFMGARRFWILPVMYLKYTRCIDCRPQGKNLNPPRNQRKAVSFDTPWKFPSASSASWRVRWSHSMGLDSLPARAARNPISEVWIWRVVWRQESGTGEKVGGTERDLLWRGIIRRR